MKGRVAAAVLVVVLVAVLDNAFGISVQTTPKVVEAARGKSVSLQCKFVTTAASLGGNGEWKKFSNQAEVITRFFEVDTTVGEKYTDRVAFTGQPDTGDLSIDLNQLKMEDNGTYLCEVMIIKDRTGSPIDRVDLVVLVAPSKPKQSIAGTLEYGQVVTLTCFSEEGSPIPTYTWQSYSAQGQPRPLPPTAVADKGDLTLKNISVDTSGFYIATVTNKVGTESCNITVGVMPPSMNIAFYAGIIGGSVLGIIVIGVIVYCCCCRNRDDKEGYEMEEREEGEQRPQGRPLRQQDDYEDEEEHEQRSAGPPKPPSNKPKQIEVDADA